MKKHLNLFLILSFFSFIFTPLLYAPKTGEGSKRSSRGRGRERSEASRDGSGGKSSSRSRKKRREVRKEPVDNF